jgi:aminopeptidase N
MLQQRFLLIPNAASTDSSRWWVPLTFTSDFSRPHVSDWMPNNQSDMQINNMADPGQWVIFNVDQVGQSMNFNLNSLD